MNYQNKKTKIVCTIGPATCDKNVILELVQAGMNIARLNGSHNTLEWHSATISKLREFAPEVPILVDLPGRKIRTTDLKKDISFKKDETIVLTSDASYVGTEKAPVNYSNLHQDLSVGNTILADDGTLKFEVVKIENRDIILKAFHTGILKSCKGINVPYVKVNTPLVTERDKVLIKFSIQEKIDFVGVSFVESGDHVDEVRSYLGDSKIEVISKVENQFGIENLESILDKTFGILIDRGDLGAETKIEHISIKQKEIIKAAKSQGKPVIVATEMLHTMIENPQPTKAEVNDISNAVLDGCAAVMLSGESAVGEYPIEAVQVMSSIIKEVEAYEIVKNYQSEARISVKNTPNAIGRCIDEVCKDMEITKIVCVSKTGYSAQIISSYRPKQEILLVTDTHEKARKCNLFWGVTGHAFDIEFKREGTEHLLESIYKLYKAEHLTRDDMIVFTAVRFPNAENKMNFLEIHKISDLIELFKWDRVSTAMHSIQKSGEKIRSFNASF